MLIGYVRVSKSDGRSAKKNDNRNFKDGSGCHGRSKIKFTNVARRLGITTTLYDYMNGDGSVKEKGQGIIDNISFFIPDNL